MRFVALAIGWLLVGEPLDVLDAAAVLLILVGVMVLRLGGRQADPTTSKPPTRPRRDLRSPWLEGGDQVAGGAADADERGGGGAGPVAVADQVQPGFSRACVPTVRRCVRRRAAEAERCEVAEGGPEAGAPDDGVRRERPAVGPRDAAG